MAQIDLSKPLETSQELEKPTFSRSSGAVAIPEEDPGEGGGFTDRDAASPRFVLLHPLSKHVDESHPAGEFYFGKPPVRLGKTVEMVIGSVQKLWVEDRPSGQSTQETPPKYFFTEQDARASGLAYMPGAIVKAVVNVTSLPDEVHDESGAILVGEEFWAPVDWHCTTKSTYPVVRDNLSRIGIGKATSAFGGVWRGARLKYRSKKVDGKKGPYHVAEFIGLTKSSPELQEALVQAGLVRSPKAA